MPKDKTRIRLNRKTVFSGMFVISLLMIMLSVSFSWFTKTGQAVANVGMIHIEEAENLLIRESGDENWGWHIDMNAPDAFVFQPIAGNGVSFFAPEKDGRDLDTGSYETTSDGYKVYGNYLPPALEAIADPSTHAYVLDFQATLVNSDGTPDLYDLKLMPGSEISSSSNEDAYTAIRVAFLQKNATGNFELTCLWAPHDDKITVVSESGEQTVTSGELYVLGEMTEGFSIGQLTAQANTKNPSDFRVIIWLDGNDAECTNAIWAEEFSVKLNLESVKISAETE